MSGKERFGVFARANNLVGVESSDSPPRVPRFNKPARLPSSEEAYLASKRREFSESGMGGTSPVPSHSRSERKKKEKRRRDDESREFRRRMNPSRSRGRRSVNPSGKGESERSGRSRRRKATGSEPDAAEELAKKKRESLPASKVQKSAGIFLRGEIAPPRDKPTKGEKEQKQPREKSQAAEPFGGFHPDKLRPDPSPKSFEKGAAKPEDDEESYSYVTEEEEAPIPPVFAKVAQVPEFPTPPPEEKTLPKVTPRAGATAENAESKEKAALETFDMKALEIYLELQERGVEMEIDSILKEVTSDEDWVLSFSSLVRPKRAATGLRYARLVENLITWTKVKEGEAGPKNKGILDRDSVWTYLHDLSLRGVGRYTPKGVVNAIRFFGEAFGLESSSVLCRRVKKLTETYCKQTKPRNQAPMLTLKTLELLESAVTNPSIQSGIRIAAGKLRLCVQASLRWDDLARTPLANVEWVRRKGSERVIGLRSRFGTLGLRPCFGRSLC